jgi:hypothetical protein
MNGIRRLLHLSLLATSLFVVLIFFPNSTHAARLFLAPSSGAIFINSTFDVAILLDTEEETVNAFDIQLQFPPELLQLVTPTSIGESIVGIWTGTPQFNNLTGNIRLQGGIPNGISSDLGLISKLTFRAKQAGVASVVILDNARVLLNDSFGTDAKVSVRNSVYNIALPLPEGPIVVSGTHPDQDKWYSKSNVVFRWSTGRQTEGYSYELNDNPVYEPDNISEGTINGVSYNNLESGIHYFHIKEKLDGLWGGSTHFVVHIDNSPPAEFDIRILPSKLTTSSNIVVSYDTTDRHSGVRYYDLKVESLNAGKIPQVALLSYLDNKQDASNFFVEVENNEVLELGKGEYNLIVRAHDNAGNVQSSVVKLEILEPFLGLFDRRGVVFNEGRFILNWPIFIALIIFMVSLFHFRHLIFNLIRKLFE